jgi:hypothetical protein
MRASLTFATSIQPTQERIHNLENSLALARAAAGTERHAPGSLPTSQTAEGAQLETGLEIKNGVPNGGVFNGGFGSDRGSGGKVPQSPSPHNWAPMNPSRSSDLACDAARQASAQHGTTMGGTHPTIQLVHVNPRARARRSVVERRRRRRDAAARGGERTAPRAPRH